MFVIDKINENFSTVKLKNGKNPEFILQNCTLTKPPFLYNDRYYIIIKPPSDAMMKINSINKTLKISCRSDGELRIKCRFSYNKFITSIFRNNVHIPFCELNDNDQIDTIHLSIKGISFNQLQFVAESIKCI